MVLSVVHLREACIQRHLLAGDNKYSVALNEASNFQMPKQLCSMFAVICVYCQPADPQQLWISHQNAHIEDFTRNYDHDVAVDHDIDKILHENSSSCAAIGLPSPQGGFINNQPSSLEPAPTFDDQTNEQHHLLENILQSILSSAGEESVPKLHYVDAPGGSGKTYVFNKLSSYLKHQNMKVACAAWAGIANTLMVDGCTVHKLFKLPVPVVENSTCRVSPSSEHANLFREIKLIIVE